MNSAIDVNSRDTITARLNTDGVTIVRIEVDPSTHRMQTNDNTTGTDMGGMYAAFDENGRPTLFAESSAGDGTLVALYANSSGELLTDSH